MCSWAAHGHSGSRMNKINWQEKLQSSFRDTASSIRETVSTAGLADGVVKCALRPWLHGLCFHPATLVCRKMWYNLLLTGFIKLGAPQQARDNGCG